MLAILSKVLTMFQVVNVPQAAANGDVAPQTACLRRADLSELLDATAAAGDFLHEVSAAASTSGARVLNSHNHEKK